MLSFLKFHTQGVNINQTYFVTLCPLWIIIYFCFINLMKPIWTLCLLNNYILRCYFYIISFHFINAIHLWSFSCYCFLFVLLSNAFLLTFCINNREDNLHCLMFILSRLSIFVNFTPSVFLFTKLCNFVWFFLGSWRIIFV